MAEEAKKKADAPDKAAPAADKAHDKKEGGGGLLTKMPVLIGGVMIIEAAVLFAGFKFLGGGPQGAAAADLTTTAGGDAGHAKSDGHGDGHGGGDGKSAAPDPKATMEVSVVEEKFLNKKDGRSFLYDVSVFAVISATDQEKIEATIKQRKALIRDRIRTIIAISDPEKLGGGSEPGLETLRRQVKYQLDQIIGADMIAEVLVPRCTPIRTDF